MILELKHSKLFHQLYIILYLSILIFLIGFNFTDSPPPPFGWYQQFMPNLGEGSIVDITFTDSLSGFAITHFSNDTSFILKTTNGGDNWFYCHSDAGIPYYNRIQFINQNTGFVGGYISFNYSYYILKTTNVGLNWFYINAPYDFIITDISVLNEDTIWVVGCNGFYDAVMQTTNGGSTWQEQFNWGSLQDSKIYMFNARIGFMSYKYGNNIYKTTNSGLNWFVVATGGGAWFSDMHFIDSLTGWQASYTMRKTTNGGLNWIDQVLPYGGNILTTGIGKFSNINSDTIFGVGAGVILQDSLKGMIYKTTNGGNNWLFQVPNVSPRIQEYDFIKFVSKHSGWAYTVYGNRGLHTVTGGDTVWYMGIVQKSRQVPKNFILKQNYPNPFNPRTVINYDLKISSYVRLIVYDITGREVQRLVDQRQTAGEYEVDFMGKFVSSGVYLYRMQVTDEKGNATFSDTKKMILIK